MEIKSTEFFRNLKSFPEVGTTEYDDLIKWELDKCMGGINIHGIHIPGILYGHLNHWHIIGDGKDKWGNIVRIPKLPDLRDNEWERAEYYEKARLEKRGYMEVGLRQGGKSEWIASHIGMTAQIYQNGQNVLVAGNAPDMKLLTEKIDFGMRHMWEGIGVPKLDKDWRRPTLRLGFKEDNNEDHVWSYIMVRNADDGKNTEAGAGTTAKSAVYDEIGKYPFSQVFEAHKPAFVSEWGWRCVPMLIGTGGSFDKGADAERVFYHPEANNFQSVIDQKTKEETGLFMSGLYRQDCKEWSDMYTYLTERGDLNISEKLKEIPIKVSNKELAKETIEAERKQKSKDPDRTEYLKQIMYYPLTPKECFMSSSDNFYNGGLALQQKEKIEKNEIKAEYVELYFDGTNIKHREAKGKVPISSFPTKSTEDLDAPISIWEHPVENPPYGLYVAGVDPFKFAQSKNSDSLGAVYIFKRMHDIYSESFQDCFVASYVANPKEKSKWEEQAALLIEYYNAQALVENDERSFCDYMVVKGKGHLLEDQPQWLTEIIPNSTIKRPKGISRSSGKIINELRSIFKKYLEEKLTDIKGTDGNVVGQVLGMMQVYDPMLCAEIGSWNYDGNFDREVAASLAVTQARKMDKMGIRIEELDEDEDSKPQRKKREINPFKTGKIRSSFRRPLSPFKTRR